MLARTRLISICLLTTVAAAAAAAHSKPWSPTSLEPSYSARRTGPRAITAVEGDVYGGVLEIDTFHVPKGVTSFVQSDLLIKAGESISIEGTLVVLDAASTLAGTAPSVELASEQWIGIGGILVGGRGADSTGVEVQGGPGSSFVLHAPVVWVDGFVEGGPGGEGGAGGKGGTGESVEAYGWCLTHVEAESFTQLRGGPGGPGGASLSQSSTGRGSDGGDGGSATS